MHVVCTTGLACKCRKNATKEVTQNHKTPVVYVFSLSLSVSLLFSPLFVNIVVHHGRQISSYVHQSMAERVQFCAQTQ